MKKRVKKILIVSLLFIMGIGCIFAMIQRAEQINRSMDYEESYSINN